MRKIIVVVVILASSFAHQAFSLSMAPEEFAASRQLACVLAEQSLGHLTETEYGARTHIVLDGFDEMERDNILSKALGYMDGLMFAIDDGDLEQVNGRLQSYVQSSSCEKGDYHQVTVSL